MKKYIGASRTSIVLVLFLFIFSTACESDDLIDLNPDSEIVDPPDDPSQEEEPAQEEEPTDEEGQEEQPSNQEESEDLELDTAFSSAVNDAINEYRKVQGLPPMEEDVFAQDLALEHTRYMIEQNSISHDQFSARAEQLFAVGASAVAENVAFGYANPQAFVRAWLDSPGHKANIVGNYTHSGVAVVKNAAGRYYATQLFVSYH
ncbi:CAP domain-containing protein [Croceiramulus getboli]|nr:CAP domain-containing protein [Flavobacteriaceae bacterium YJPT1-3]